MARDKVTITLDRARADRARALLSAPSISEAIDIALERVVRAELLRRDVAAYTRNPPTGAEAGLAASASTDDLQDDTDWELLYREELG